MPSQVTTAAATTGLAYSTQRKIEQLCDGSYLALVQTAITTLKLVQITSPSGTPSFTTLAQTFTFAGANNTVGDLFILNNGTTTSDVWVVWSDNSTNTGLYVAHGTYTASGSSWSWDNTSTSIALGSYTSGFMLPSVVWTGSNLIIVTRANTSNYGIAITYTSTKNGSSGWAALAWLDGGGLGSHCYPLVRHDAANGCTLCVYSLANDTVYGRVIADGSTPSVANWSSAVTLSGASAVGVGAANISAVLDTANKRIHVAYGNSSVSTNPIYTTATYTTTAITAGTPISVDSGATTFTGPSVALDNASPPNAYVFWATGAVGSASDIEYAKIASPYSSAGSATNLTSASGNDNAYPHVPAQAPLGGGYVPLLYAHAVSPWAVEYDNSISISTVYSGAATLKGQGKLTAAGNAAGVGAATLKGQGALTAAGLVVITASVTLKGHGAFSASQYAPGTGIGDLALSTQTQTWVNSGSGTETDITYEDGSNSGWRVGIIPSYGGAVISAWYEINSGAVAGAGTLDSNGSQTDLYTQSGGGGTNPDGWTHSLEESTAHVTFNGGYDGSESYSFANAGSLTELAPVGTVFRRGYLALVKDGVALQTGLKVQVTTYIYPGDPGMIVDRIDWINPTASAVSLDSLNLTSIGGLLDTSATPAGAWTHSNAQQGTVGGTPTSVPSSQTAGEPDYFAITPNGAYGQKIGLVAVKGTVLGASGYNWSPQIAYDETTTGSTPNDRIKMYYITGGASYSIPANTTQSYYVLKSLRRSLTSSDAAAIAADYLNPGTLSVSAGSLVTQTSDTPAGRTASAFAWSERAWVVQASATAGVGVTLDMTPAHVTVRFKPVFKLTNWTTGSAPIVTWGGAALTAGVDYRHVEDTTNHICYVQLYFDVVASGAGTGQRNNAALNIQPSAVSGAVTFSGQGKLTDSGVESFAGAATLKGHGAVTAAGVQVLTGLATLRGQGRLTAAGLQVLTGAAALKGQGRLVASGFTGYAGAATLKGQGKLTALGNVADFASATLHGQGRLTALGAVVDIGAAALKGHGQLTVSGFVVTSGAATFVGHGRLQAAAVEVLTGAAVNRGHGQLTASGVQVLTGAAALHGQGRLVAAGVQVVTGAVTLAGHGVLRASSSQTVGGSVVAPGRGRLLVTGIQVVSKAAVLSGQGHFSASGSQFSTGGMATLPGHGRLRVSGLVLLTGAATLRGQGRLVAALTAPGGPVGVSVTSGANAPVGVTVTEA